MDSTPSSASGGLANGHTPLTERVQIIDEDKKFNANLSNWIGEWGLRDAGFDYDVVAVFGSQSTGKSTLLNRLFGTTFDVMDESNRRQTTKGIWMCRAQGMPVLVMDVEGTDGRERGEDQDFERKSALFSLASSQVLLVNMWEQQIGLYQGANMALLKTVIEVNLSLFGKTDQKTLLLFVIRDHVGATPLSNLQATLTSDVERIWGSVSKPEGLESRLLTDYFDLTFVTLPHKLLMPEKFDAEVAQLRTRFTMDGKGFFRERYRRRIPADGVGKYMESIWDQVSSNKDLDLPTQQELLAQFRCDEIAKVATEAFLALAKEGRKGVEGGKVVPNLGAKMRDWMGEALRRFDNEASRYHASVYKSKRADLQSSLFAILQPLFLAQLKNLHKRALQAFKQDLLEGLKGDGYDFATVVGGARERAEGAFVDGAKEAQLEGTDWDSEDELEHLKEEMTTLADVCKSDEMKKTLNAIERTFKRDIGEKVDLELSRPGSEMWDAVLRIFSENLVKAEETYTRKAKSFNTTPSENEQSLNSLRRRTWLALRAKVDEHTSEGVLMTKLRSNFEERFRYDETGVPRVWSKKDDIDGLFRQARDETIELVPLYAHIAPSDASLLPSIPSDDDVTSSAEEPFDFPATLQILSDVKQADLKTRFRRDADAYFIEAKRSVVSSVAQIPLWIYGALVVLGWNEAMTVLFNPLYFVALLMAAAGAYTIIQLNLAGPLIQVSRTVISEVQQQVHLRLKEHFAEPPVPERVPISANGRVGIRQRKFDNETEHEEL